LIKKLKAEIDRKANNTCAICGRWSERLEPHHVVKVSEEPLLRNCETNIMPVDRGCHHKTETEPGFNKKLQIELQKKYEKMFINDRYYSLSVIANMVNMPYEDLETAAYKGIIQTQVSMARIAKGEDVIRFLMGGKIHAQ